MWAVWGCVSFGLWLVVSMAAVSDAVARDRKRPHWYRSLPYEQRRFVARPLMLLGLGLFLAGMSTVAGRESDWRAAQVIFGIEGVVLVAGALWFRHRLRTAS